MATAVASSKRLQLILLCAIVGLLLQSSPTQAQNDNLRPYFTDTEISYSIYENFNTSLSINSDNPLVAFDPEGDSVTYYIPNGGVGYLDFEIETVNGSGYLYFMRSVTLDRESRTSYSVRVYVRDGQYHGAVTDHFIDISIKIRDINDVTPDINDFPSALYVSESTTPGTQLYRVQAEDDDSGPNGIVAFRIYGVSPVSGRNKFSIISSSGQLSLSQSLDYEGVKEYQLTIEAYDLGTPPLRTSEILTIRVTDVNDNPPQFDQTTYARSIYENASMGSLVLTVSAYDLDRMIDDNITYSFNPSVPLISGQPSFVINDTTGSVYVNAPLDYEGNMTTYSLFVQASEVNDPGMKTSVPLTITILDLNDNPPQFLQKEYNRTLSELTRLGTDVVTVMANDPDSGANGEFEFELMNLLATPLPFNISASIDGRSGTIQVSQLLDYESYREYKFEVLAVETVADNRKTATATVSVTITNENDNDPVFSQLQYSANVSENANDGQFVAQVSAQDDDDGSFGVVHYTLIDGFGKFEINNMTGIISTIDTIDYEAPNEKSFSLSVVANDSAIPVSTQRSQKVLVIVSVLDRNDNGPVIMANDTDKTIEENQAPGQLVFVIDATDADVFPNNQLTYSLRVLSPANLTEEPFEFSSISPNQLLTNVMFDYEDIKQYRVRLYVTDLGHLLDDDNSSSSGMNSFESVLDLPADHVDFVDITVSVIDENDERPVFVGGATSYSFNVTEEEPNGTYVGTVEADDVDTGLYGTVRYSISGIDHENFSINSTSGVISTAGPIDRERKDRFDLIVTAYDLGPTSLSSTATLTITINDINDNTPIFSQPVYYDNDIYENSTSVSITVLATDRDIGTNEDITYNIASGNQNNTFVIDPSTGAIGLNPSKFLDRESIPDYHLIIEAIDNGATRRTGNATVVIVLQDVDDNDPTFPQATYMVNITEDTASGSFVTMVTARDPDFGNNGLVRYQFEPINNDNFAIDEGSGSITTKRMFDFETNQRSYSLYVKAQDHNPSEGSPGYTKVDISILDVNDNSPIFSPSSYQRSISEDAAGDSSIVRVSARDADSGTNAVIEYLITDVQTVGVVVSTDEQADNLTDLFYIGPSDGVLYLSSDRSFDYESVKIYNVYVAAIDGGSPSMNESTVVTITITDYNDNPPVLSSEEYNLTLSESTAVNTLHNLYTSYTDADSGDNAVVDYAIEGTDLFSINSFNGILTLESPLDYETPEDRYFNFTLTVTDRGSPQMSDSAIVFVYVTDSNDNDPEFINGVSGAITIEIPEGNYTQPQLLFDFNATDRDSGAFGNVSISITSSSESGIFSIPDPVDGRLYLMAALDREEEDTYTLTITASDGGSPPRTATTSVTVSVQDVNEAPPMFPASSYSYNIDENQATMTLLTVSATDNDNGANGTVRFRVDNDTYVTIGEVSGIISSTGPYDYEEVHSFQVTVVTYDLGSPSLSSEVPLTVTINDLNDNTPAFEYDTYGPYEVSEDASTGFTLVRVGATDRDSGPNQDISYTLENGGGRFTIDSGNGDITLASSLDREQRDYYMLIVKAYDHGNVRNTATVSLNVSVLDVNDNSPEFLNTDIPIQMVSENATNGSVIFTLRSIDPDLDSNGTITYNITSGNSLGLFNVTTVLVNSSYEGRLMVSGNLDYETRPLIYNLRVTASDMGPTGHRRSTGVNVVISIINVNDNYPDFSQTFYIFYVSEVASSGTSVGIVQATDGDLGVFGQISSYMFADDTSSDITGNFTISSSSGVITLASGSSLDYEQRKDFNFSVVATDNGGLSSSVPVSVIVVNYNDNQPRFDQSSYNASIYENVTNGTDVITVHASDPEGDSGITYSIVDGSFGQFAINPTTGLISTSASLDREVRGTYVLRVQATDTGGSPLSGFTQVAVTILDVNDNSPVFDSHTLDYSLLETSDSGISLSPVAMATDADDGVNSLVSYYIEGEGVPSVFAVNSSTGVISLQSGLNHEVKQNYTFVLYAEDGGASPRRSTNVTVTVYVLDFNDNTPRLGQSVYNRTVSESFSNGGLLLTVTAEDDDDAGPNSDITFSITEVQGVALSDSPFAIGGTSGEITTTASLDYESRSSYTIIIRAEDNGIPQKLSTGTVLITLTDVNDNYPIFSLATYSHSVPEAPVGSNGISILTISASDNDGTSPNNYVTYNITGGNIADTFEINSTTGEIVAVKDLDYEGTKVYTLSVMAQDNPLQTNQTRTNTTTVTISIEDINDNSPIWQYTMSRVGSDDLYSGVISENAGVRTEVLRVLARDFDDSAQFGTVYYDIITNTNDFEVNETTGYIYTASSLDSDTVSMYNLSIEARDGGTPPNTITADVYILVTDINDKIPYFLSNFYTETISESTPVGNPVITLSAIDSDSTNLTYSITEGDDFDFFRINSSTGVVYVKNTLDREKEENVEMMIKVTDGSFNDTTRLRIVLTDVNDNAPVFLETHYYADINENVFSGAVLLYGPDGNTTRIEAIDKDKAGTSNSLVVYDTAGPNRDYLNIDPQTAVLTVATGAMFNYEAQGTVDIIITASDSVNPPFKMSSNVTITVTVVDVNDLTPSFQLNSYLDSISENIPINTVLSIDIEARDNDTGLGGKVVYSIVSSDPILSQQDFSINSTNGDVTVIGELDRETTPSIQLTIRARDSITPFHFSDVILTISLDDVNDNAPTFNQSVYHVSISEDDGSGGVDVPIIMLNASDRDFGINAQRDYTIKTYTDRFKVNTNGRVLTILPLDHETDPMLEFIVQVCDRGIPNKMCSNATISLTVLDINDGVPTFDYSLYRTSLCNDTQPDGVVLHISATDTDSGDNGDVDYSIVSGSLPSYLTFYNSTGQIILTSEVPSSEVGLSYNFDVRGTDGGSPPLFNTTSVRIDICDREAEVLRFNQTYYYGDLAENESPPVDIAIVMALSSYGPITYSISPPSRPLPFNISSSGTVSTTESLDKEERDEYTLLIEAVDSAPAPNTAYTTLTVIVRDVNDNPPTFLLTPYFFEITEEETGYVDIGKALAIDPDQPLAESGVRYSLDPSTNPDNTFIIDATNGSIIAIKPLDRETIDSVQLRILAKDLDLQDQRVTTATAYVTILDINDNKPMFESPSYSAFVPEDRPSNYLIGSVRANDSDIDDNQRLTYTIVSGAEGKFILESNFGMLSTTGQLDFETDNFYNLTIKAQDGGVPPQSSFTYFEVHIEDINDCVPQFTESSYSHGNILENATSGLFLFDIDANDCDSGKNSEIQFSVTGGDASVFFLNSTSGLITLQGPLDYETTSFYSFEVRAADQGSPSLFNLTQVTISISDVNDESPVFSGDPYISTVPEDISVGYIIVTATATDNDLSSANNQIRYEILSGNDDGRFELHSTTGAFSVLNPLDRERQDSYHVVIHAIDNGNPQQSDITNITVTVEDVNDNPPVFVGFPTDPIMIEENSTNNTDIIFRVSAIDPDIGMLEYSLSIFTNIFTIGPNTGVVTRYSIIDYEEVKSFELPIQVTDGIHTIQRTLQIAIEDINDNYPLFTQSEYTGEQSEGSSPGTLILQVQATDEDDSYINKAVTYYIIGCTNCGRDTLFNINSTTGQITNARPLDREANSEYTLTVMAINEESDNDLSTTANVVISITDINDHAPVFNKSSYDTSISELTPDGSYVLTVSATDGDEPNTPNSDVRYFIASTIANNPFRLDEITGVLSVAGGFDRELISAYNFSIEASDRGSPIAMSSTVSVTVTLLDENDQRPLFAEKTQSVNVREDVNQFPYPLWQLRYSDADSDIDNRQSTYQSLSLLNGTLPIDYPLVQVNSTTGEVMLMGPVDFETTKSVSVLLSVNNTKIGVGSLCGSDRLNSTCSLFDTAQLTVVINDYNDNPPVLEKTTYSSHVSTAARTGTQIIQIKATDLDTENNYGTIRYATLPGSSLKFQVNAETGWITTRGTFSNNDGESFNVIVQAYDNFGNDPYFSATATVRVLAISDFKRVLLLLGVPIGSECLTVENERFITQTLANLTGYTIVVEDVRQHILGDSGNIDETQTDFIFHAVDPATGEIVDFDVFIRRLDVAEFFRLIDKCNPQSITSLLVMEDNEPVETIMIFLMVLCFILIVGALVTLVLACQQRYIALRSLMKNQVLDAFYGNPDPSLLEGGAMPRDFSGESFEMKARVTKNALYSDPYFQMNPLETSGAASSVGDASSMQADNPLYGEYADEELRVDLFQPPSDDETEGDIDEGRLLHAALHEEEDEDDDDSATLI